MTAASGTAAPQDPDPGRTPHNLITRTATAPVPRCQTIGLPAGHPKDASGAAPRPGSARSLTRPSESHANGSYRETGDASHARPATP